MIADPPLRRILAACLLPLTAGLLTCGAAAENAGVPQQEPPARPTEPVAAGLPKGQTLEDYCDTYMFGIWTDVGTHWKAVGKGQTFQDWDEWARKGVLPYNLRVLNTDFDVGEGEAEENLCRVASENGLWCLTLLAFGLGYESYWRNNVEYREMVKRHPAAQALGPDGKPLDPPTFDPAHPEFSEALKEGMSLRLRRLGKYRAWIGFSLVADHAMLPGQYTEKGIGVTPATLTKFVKTDFYTATLAADGAHRFFQQPKGKHAPAKELRREDFAKCRLREMFVDKSKTYSMAEIWEDLRTYHMESEGGTVGWPTFLRFETYCRIKEALDWFSQYTGREWLFYKEGGGTEVLTSNFQRLGAPRNWHTPVAGPGHWAMTAFPEQWIYSNFDDKLLTARIRHWGWMGLRHPGDNNGLVTPDEVKKGLCYFYPVYPVVPVLADCTHENLQRRRSGQGLSAAGPSAGPHALRRPVASGGRRESGDPRRGQGRRALEPFRGRPCRPTLRVGARECSTVALAVCGQRRPQGANEHRQAGPAAQLRHLPLPAADRRTRAGRAALWNLGPVVRLRRGGDGAGRLRRACRAGGGVAGDGRVPGAGGLFFPRHGPQSMRAVCQQPARRATGGRRSAHFRVCRGGGDVLSRGGAGGVAAAGRRIDRPKGPLDCPQQ
jgi:hypothetical protein